MSDPEVVVRLLAAIDDREATAREATKWSAPEWTTASSAVLDLGIPDLDGLVTVPASPISRHMEENDPAAVLRLCQSHRDIVDMYQQAVREEALGDGGTGLQGVLVYAVATLENVIAALARGYGVEEQ